MDFNNYVFLEGENQDEVEACPAEDQNMGVASVMSLPTKTKMFEDLKRKKFRIQKIRKEEEEKRKV